MFKAGQPIHHMHLRITIDGDFTIVAAQAVYDAAPYGEHCMAIESAYADLIGMNPVSYTHLDVYKRQHMCYSEFNDIIESIAAMDADVITIETSRSNMELLKAFEDFRYPNDIGQMCIRDSVSTIRMMIAAAEPTTIAFFCCAGGSERAASAITTALSPDSRMLTQMIWSNACLLYTSRCV